MEFNKEQWLQEKKEQRNQLYEDINNQVSDVVSSPESFKSFLDTVSHFDQYSLNNVLLINKYRPNATLIKTFDDWKKDKIQVNKDTKGFYIFKPMKVKGKEEQRINPVCVFDVAQTSKRTYSPSVYQDKTIIKGLISACGVKVDLSDNLAPTTLSTFDVDNQIILLKKDMKTSDIIKNLSKEAAQSIHSHNNQNYNRNDYSMNAFIISYLTCKKYNINTDSFKFDGAVEKLSKLSPKDLKESLNNLVKENKTLQHRVDSYLYKETQSHER